MPEGTSTPEPVRDLELAGQYDVCKLMLCFDLSEIAIMLHFLLGLKHRLTYFSFMDTFITFSVLLISTSFLLWYFAAKHRLAETLQLSEWNEDSLEKGHVDLDTHTKRFLRLLKREFRLRRHIWEAGECGTDLSFFGSAAFIIWVLWHALASA